MTKQIVPLYVRLPLMIYNKAIFDKIFVIQDFI